MSGLTRLQHGLLVGLALAAVLLVILNAVLLTRNREVQREVTLRNQFVQQSLQLEPIYQELIRALADSALNRQDEALRQPLASQGITVDQNAAAAPASPPVLPPEEAPQ